MNSSLNFGKAVTNESKPITAIKETTLAPISAPAVYARPTLKPNDVPTPSMDNKAGPGVATNTITARTNVIIFALGKKSYFGFLNHEHSVSSPTVQLITKS